MTEYVLKINTEKKTFAIEGWWDTHDGSAGAQAHDLGRHNPAPNVRYTYGDIRTVERLQRAGYARQFNN